MTFAAISIAVVAGLCCLCLMVAALLEAGKEEALSPEMRTTLQRADTFRRIGQSVVMVERPALDVPDVPWQERL